METKKRIERIKKEMQQSMIDFNNKHCFSMHYTQEEIDRVQYLSDDFVLYRGRLLNIK